LKKRKSLFFCFALFFFFILSSVSGSQDQVIVIDSAIEYRFFNDKPEKIESFIQEYEKKIAQLITKLNSFSSQQLSEEQKRELNDTLSLLEGISFQFVRLKREIKAQLSQKLPSLPDTGNPPFKLTLFETYLDLYHQVIRLLKESQKKLKVLSTELADIEGNLKQIFTQYVQLRKEPQKKLTYYATLAQLISLQVEYALKILKKKQVDAQIKYLLPLISQCKKKMSYIFDNLYISKSDIRGIKEQVKNIEKKLEDLKSNLISVQRSINKDMTLFELRLDNIQNRLSSAKLTEAGKKLLRIEKEKIEAYLKRFQYKKELLSQQELNLKLRLISLSFKYAWLRNYMKQNGYQKTEALIREWSNKIEKLQDEALQLKEKLDQRQFDFSILNERLVRIDRELEIEKDPDVKDSLRRLQEELNLNKSHLSQLIDVLSKNLFYTKTVISGIQSVLLLIKTRTSTLEKILYEAKNSVQSFWTGLKAVLYYPLWSMGGNVVTVITILRIVFFLCLGIYLLKLIRKKLSKFLIEKAGLSVGVVNSISTLSYYFMLILVLFIALSTAGINLSQITIILGALGVGIGFGLQTIANNFISGLILLTERTIKVGDIVELENGIMGKVKDVSIRSTVIRTYDGLDLIVPNSDFIANKVATWTYADDWRRLRIQFGVSYNSDPDRVAEIAKEVARQIPTTIEDEEHPVSVWFEGFGESSLDFSLLVWCRMEQLKPITGLMSDYYFALFRRFKQEGIEIPFPQRDLHIKSLPEGMFNSFELKKTGKEKKNGL